MYKDVEKIGSIRLTDLQEMRDGNIMCIANLGVNS